MAAAPPRPTARPADPRRARTLSWVELVEYLRGAGFRDDRPSNDRYPGRPSSELAVAAAIASSESGRRTQAVGRSGGKYYLGLFQIQATTLNRALFDPAANTRAAYGLYTSNGRRFGAGTVSSCRWSVFCSGRYRVGLGSAERAIKATQGFERSGVLAPGRTASEAVEAALSPIEALFVKWIVPSLKIAGGVSLMIVSFVALTIMLMLGESPTKAAGRATGLVGGAATARTPARAAAVAERARVRSAGRSELARARVSSTVRASGRERVRISSRAEGRRRLAEEAELEGERREGSRRDRPAGGLRVIEGVGPGAKGRRRSAA